MQNMYFSFMAPDKKQKKIYTRFNTYPHAMFSFNFMINKNVYYENLVKEYLFNKSYRKNEKKKKIIYTGVG